MVAGLGLLGWTPCAEVAGKSGDGTSGSEIKSLLSSRYIRTFRCHADVYPTFFLQ